MNEQTVNNLFNPFYTTKASGTGLGLVLVQKVVTEHKGQVVVHSKIGDGTTFTLLSNYFSEDVERTSVITQMNPEDACAAINPVQAFS